MAFLRRPHACCDLTMRFFALQAFLPSFLRRPLVLSGVVLLLGFALTAWATAWQIQQNQYNCASHLDGLLQNTVDQLKDRLAIYEYGLRGARGAVLGAGLDHLERKHFQEYSASRQIEREFPGARGFGVIRRVDQKGESAFVAAAQKDGWPGFSIHQFAAHAGERYVIQYVEPIERNREAVGLDIASDPSRKSAAEQAMRTGQATLTGPINLIQQSDASQNSFLLLLPIYRPDMDVTSPERREIANEGWSFAPLMIDEVLRNVDLHREHLALSLSDVSEKGTRVFYRSPSAEPALDALSQRASIAMYGRIWEVDVKVLPLFFQDSDTVDPVRVAVLGLVMSVLLAALAGILQKEKQQAELVRLERSRRASMVDYSADAIIGESMDGRVTDWNPAAERLFGYTVAQARHQSLAMLLLPPERVQEDIDILTHLSRGDVLPPIDTTRMHQNGSLLDVSVTAAPILDADGRCIGIVKTLRDIGPTKRAELRVRELNANLEQQVLERTALLDAARRELQLILDAVPSQIGYWDQGLINRMANEAYRQWFGIEPASLQGMHMRDLLGPEVYARSLPALEAALRGQPQSFFEQEIPRMDGSGKRHALVNYLPDIVNGEVRGLIALVHDVSELVDGRLKLGALQRENEALLRTIYLHSIVSVADRSGQITEVNESFCQVSGYSREQLIGRKHTLMSSGVQDKEFWSAVWSTISARQPWRGEICNRASDGSVYWVGCTIAPFIAADGQVEKYICVGSNITASKMAEQTLRESQAFQDKANRVAKVGAWQMDMEPLHVVWSPQLKLIHEVPPDYQPRLEDGLAFYVPEDRPIMQGAVERAMASGQGWDLELQMETAQNHRIWVRVLGEAEMKQGRTVRLVGIMQDITTRKQIENTLTYERHLMTSLLNTVPDQIYFKDNAHRFLRINPGLARRYGLQDASEAIGLSDADFFVPEHAKETAAIERQIMETGVPVIDLEEQEVWPDRPPTWNLTTKMPLRDVQGKVIGTFGISRDITARKRIEEQLHDTNLRFEMAAGGAGLGVWDLDLVKRVLTCDARVYQQFGVPADVSEAPEALWARCLHPDDLARYQAHTEATVRGEHPLDIEFRIRRPDGEVRYLKAAGRVYRDAQGTPLRLTGVNMDITERKRAELLLVETSSLLQNVLESASEVSIIATDAQLTIRVFNKGSERLLGYSSSEMVGRQTPMLIHDPEEMWARSQELSDQLGYPVLGASVFTAPETLHQPREWTYVRKDGSRVTVSLVITAMHAADGSVFGYLGVAHDVTRQKQVEQSLRDAMLKAKQASLAKSQFLANMSHEIRTPMNAVMGLSYLMGHTALDAEQAAFLEKIRLASQSLLALINDVLDLSKIEANEMVIEQAPFDLRGLLRNVSDLMAVQAHAKGLEFLFHWPADVPEVVSGDAVRLQQVLTNLLSNAVKFTLQGQVQLMLQRLSAVDDRIRLRFSVRDSGIGIPPAVQARLFQPFMQADASTTRRFGGTGLGLSIVKHLVTLMGGQLGMESVEGAGSEFWLELDFSMVAADAAKDHMRGNVAGPGHSLQGVRVLVVDDSDINLEVAKRILEQEGALVTLASNGREAIDVLRAHSAEVDVVLMDVQMPELDGLSATCMIRQELGLVNLPVIALTAGAMVEHHAQAQAAGMDDFITKPFEVQHLVHTILRHVSAGGGSAAAKAKAEVHEPAKVPGAWPAIEGVDAQAARAQLGGDCMLFCAMLKRLLGEFHATSLVPTDWGPVSMATLAQRLHKLRGSAGMLGVTSVQQLAGEAEQACIEGSTDAVQQLVQKLDAQLHVLQQSAAPYLATYD
jgi:PAS domain S-box-containing protein